MTKQITVIKECISENGLKEGHSGPDPSNKMGNQYGYWLKMWIIPLILWGFLILVTNITRDISFPYYLLKIRL